MRPMATGGARWLLRAQEVVLEDRVLEEGAVLVAEGRIARVGRAQDVSTREVDAVQDHGGAVVPGFVDLQANGHAGEDLTCGGAAALERVRASLAREGTTAFLATTVSARVEEELVPLVRGLAAACRAPSPPGARAEVLGLHCEGPFLSPRRAGAHDPSRLQEPSPERVARLLEAGGGALRMVTLAPELPGALEAVSALARAGVVVALGHTEASLERMLEAVEHGARACTHLFNAMAPLHHRAPGPVGAGLVDGRLALGLIPDGLHLHPAVVRLVVRARGAEAVFAVSDATAAAGAGGGRFRLGGREIVSQGGAARDAEGRLAGSALSMDRAFSNLVACTGCGLVEAAWMASRNAARLLGVADRKGSIAPGRDADLVCLDGDLRAARVFCRGEEVPAVP